MASEPKKLTPAEQRKIVVVSEHGFFPYYQQQPEAPAAEPAAEPYYMPAGSEVKPTKKAETPKE